MKGASACDLHALQGSFAPRTGVSFLAIDLQSLLVAAALAGTIDVIANCRSPMGNSFFDYGDDSPMQLLQFLLGQGPPLTLGMNTGMKQSLIRVDIAETGNQALIEQQPLDLGGATAHDFPEIINGEF